MLTLKTTICFRNGNFLVCTPPSLCVTQLIASFTFIDFDFDDTRFRSFQSQDHVQVLKTETDWPRWYGDGANQIIIVTKTRIGLGGAKQIVNVTI